MRLSRLRRRTAVVVSAVAVLVCVGGCTRNASDAKPTASAGVPPVVTVATLDFPSQWVAQRVGGDAVEVRSTTADELANVDTDLVAYVPGLDPTVDAAVTTLPSDRVVDLIAGVGRMASPVDPDVRDPYVWFDPVNVATMARTLGQALGEVSETPFEAFQYYGLRALSVEAEALDVDQRMQEQFNPCRIPTLVVEAPVLTYLARAYAFTQVPLILWQPDKDPVRALYYTYGAEPAVRKAASTTGAQSLPIDTFTRGAPEDDLLQGILDTADEIAKHQDCPMVTPTASDRPG